MATMTINGKFMVLVQTNTRPVNITPMLSRFSNIKKALTRNEIGACLAAGAKVTLITMNGDVVLTRDNWYNELLKYKNALDARFEANKDNVAAKENEKLLEQLKEDEQAAAVTESTPVQTRSAAPTTAEPEAVEEPVDEDEEEEDPIGEAGETAQADPEDPDEYDDSVFYKNEE